MTITCSEHLYLQPGEIEFICIGGSWFPDPNDEYCYEAQQELGKHSYCLMTERRLLYTVEPLIMDTPRSGQPP